MKPRLQNIPVGSDTRKLAAGPLLNLDYAALEGRIIVEKRVNVMIGTLIKLVELFDTTYDAAPSNSPTVYKLQRIQRRAEVRGLLATLTRLTDDAGFSEEDASDIDSCLNLLSLAVNENDYDVFHAQANQLGLLLTRPRNPAAAGGVAIVRSGGESPTGGPGVSPAVREDADGARGLAPTLEGILAQLRSGGPGLRPGGPLSAPPAPAESSKMWDLAHAAQQKFRRRVHRWYDIAESLSELAERADLMLTWKHLMDWSTLCRDLDYADPTGVVTNAPLEPPTPYQPRTFDEVAALFRAHLLGLLHSIIRAAATEADVLWAKNLLSQVDGKFPDPMEQQQAPAEQAPAEQAPAEQAPAEQAPAEQAPAEQAAADDPS